MDKIKISLHPLIIVLLALFPLFIQGQNYAGLPQTVCNNESITLGDANNPNSPYCFFWEPSNSLNDHKSPNPEANPTITTVYTVYVTDDDGNLIAEESVTVFVKGIDLQIFKPSVLAGNNTTMVTEEETIGAMTFKNEDNDDNDDLPDDNDNFIDGGDDEFMKLSIKLHPASSFSGIVKIQAISGEESVKLWLSNDKSSGEYTLGESLTLTQNGDDWLGELWVEGIEGHTSQRETVLKLTEELVDDCDDKVALTIIEIQEQKWLGINNGFTPGGTAHDSPDLDNDPNITDPTAPPAVRVFPGSRISNVDSPNNIVQLEVTLSVPPVEQLILHSKSFDVDDPTAISEDMANIEAPYNAKFIDPNDDGLTGNYSHTNIPYTPTEDNRGAIPIPATSMNSKAGLLENGNDGIAPLIFSADEAKSTINFMVTQHPGDNFMVVTHFDVDYLDKLTNDDSQGHELNIYFQEGSVTNQVVEKFLSPVLTVWRLLHLEIDSMEDYMWEENQKSGFFTDFVGVGNDLDQIKSLVDNNGNALIIDNVSCNLDNDPNINPCIGFYETDNGRFEKGRIIFGNDSPPTPPPGWSFNQLIFEGDDANDVNSPVLGNGDARIQFINDGFVADVSLAGLWCELTDPSGTNTALAILGNITRSSTGMSFNIEFSNLHPSSTTLSNFIGGTISIGGGDPKSIIASSSTISEVVSYDLHIPFIIRDDDTPPSSTNGLPHGANELDLTITIEAFKEVYVLPIIDGGGNLNNNNSDIPFVANYPLNNNNNAQENYWSSINNHRASDDNERNSFWVAAIVSAWQAEEDKDADPQGESTVYGFVNEFDVVLNNFYIAKGYDSELIFRELFEDCPPLLCSPLTPFEIPKGRIIAHEMGHQFGLSHGQSTFDGQPSVFELYDEDGDNIPDDPDTNPPKIGIMLPGFFAQYGTNSFSPRHKNLIRSRVTSPGK